MTGILTDDQLTEIENRLKGITPPPWFSWYDYGVNYWGSDGNFHEGGYEIKILEPQIPGFHSDKAKIADVFESYENAIMIANAPVDINALISTVRELKEQLDFIKREDRGLLDEIDYLNSVIDAANFQRRY